MDWSVEVYLYGEQVIPTGRVRVEAEESTARVATFTIQPPTAQMDLSWYVGKAVVIDAVVDTVTTRLFTGVVNEPDYDPRTGLLRIDCSDNLQGYFEALDEAAILAAISGGYYSEAVFGVREDGWQQALDALSTAPVAANLDRDGATLTVTAEAAKQVPDRSFAAADVIDGSIAVQVGRQRELVNRISLEAQVRFTRLHHRERSWGWNWGVVDFCDWYLDTFPLPTRDMFQSVIEGAGWGLQGAIVYETLPDSGSYNCNGPVGWSIDPEAQNQLVTNATWTAVRRWAQTVTESYDLTLQESGSISDHGAVLEEQRVGDEVEYDDGTWDASRETATPSGWSVDNLGDYYEDQTDRSQTDNTLLCMLNYCRTRILRAHRQNSVQFDVPLLPDIDLEETVRLAHGSVYATGKVAQCVHELDITTGRAVTTIKLGISRGSGAGADAEITSAPTPPDTLQPGPALPDSTVLYNYIGQDDQAPDYDPSWVGFTTNWDTIRGNPSPEQIYPIRLRVQTEDIEDASRDEATGTTSQTLEIYAPDEELVTYGIGPTQTLADWKWSDTLSGANILFSAGNLRAYTAQSSVDHEEVVTDLFIPETDGAGWYWEITVESMAAADSVEIGFNMSGQERSYKAIDGKIHDGYSSTTFGNPYGAGDVIGIAIKRNDSATRWEIYFSVNGVWQGGGDPENDTGYLYYSTVLTAKPSARLTDIASILANFGASTPQYPVPIGFQRLIYT